MPLPFFLPLLVPASLVCLRERCQRERAPRHHEKGLKWYPLELLLEFGEWKKVMEGSIGVGIRPTLTVSDKFQFPKQDSDRLLSLFSDRTPIESDRSRSAWSEQTLMFIPNPVVICGIKQWGQPSSRYSSEDGHDQEFFRNISLVFLAFTWAIFPVISLKRNYRNSWVTYKLFLSLTKRGLTSTRKTKYYKRKTSLSSVEKEIRWAMLPHWGPPIHWHSLFPNTQKDLRRPPLPSYFPLLPSSWSDKEWDAYKGPSA